jgi:hypothetical protein
MEIPKSYHNSFNIFKTTNNEKTLSLFQSYIVFQIYLFSSKQFSIEITISDTTKTKRRLIFSSNNSDLIINQLHCRIPILNVPIGTWINFSIDILSFVSECFRDLTFRSIDYISLSMSGKVRFIYTMRTPLKETENVLWNNMYGNFNFEDNNNNNDMNNNFEIDNENNNNDNNNFNNNFNEFDDYNEVKMDVPNKYKLPPREEYVNINMNCNRAINQIYLDNQIKQINNFNNANNLNINLNDEYIKIPKNIFLNTLSSTISQMNNNNTQNNLNFSYHSNYSRKTKDHNFLNNLPSNRIKRIDNLYRYYNYNNNYNSYNNNNY